MSDFPPNLVQKRLLQEHTNTQPEAATVKNEAEFNGDY
ncbi:unnamed protein product, partial [Didymodactylos carnosus]